MGVVVRILIPAALEPRWRSWHSVQRPTVCQAWAGPCGYQDGHLFTVLAPTVQSWGQHREGSGPWGTGGQRGVGSHLGFYKTPKIQISVL